MANFIAHFAIQADDLDRARDFYQRAFGWRFEPWGPPGFFVIQTGASDEAGVTEGALSVRPTNGPEPRLNAYRCSISVASASAARDAIIEHGGEVIGPIFELPEVGKIVSFVDPEGNVAAAVEYVATDRRSAHAAMVGEVGDAPRLYRVILPAGDLDESVGFYRRLLVMDGERVSPGRHYFQCGGVILAVVDPRADGDDRDARPNSDHVYLAVKELEPYHRRAADLRALAPDMGAIETRPWGERSFYLSDPFGNPLCLVDRETLFTGN